MIERPTVEPSINGNAGNPNGYSRKDRFGISVD